MKLIKMNNQLSHQTIKTMLANQEQLVVKLYQSNDNHLCAQVSSTRNPQQFRYILQPASITWLVTYLLNGTNSDHLIYDVEAYLTFDDNAPLAYMVSLTKHSSSQNILSTEIALKGYTIIEFGFQYGKIQVALFDTPESKKFLNNTTFKCESL